MRTIEGIDVVIVGGGMAGAATAIGLRQRGLSVVMIEKQQFPRPKVCGEGLLPHGVEKLRALGMDDVLASFHGQPFRGILYRCQGITAVGDFPDAALGMGLQRYLLDDALQQRAVSLGAQLIRGTAKQFTFDAHAHDTAQPDSASVVVIDAEEQTICIKARFLVGADGPRSLVRHSVGLDDGAPTEGRYAMRQHFRLADGMPMPDRVEVSVQGGHELYVTPVGDGLVGLAILLEKKMMLAEKKPVAARIQSFLDAAPVAMRERFVGATPADDAMACGPLRVKAKNVFVGNVALVGDASGYVDAITGEGMSLALSTASLLSEALASVFAKAGASAQTAKPIALRAALQKYAKARADLFLDHALLTHGLVFLVRHPFLARRAVGRLAKDPALFTQLLAVNNGTKRFWALGLPSMLKLAIGASAPKVLADTSHKQLPPTSAHAGS